MNRIIVSKNKHSTYDKFQNTYNNKKKSGKKYGKTFLI